MNNAFQSRIVIISKQLRTSFASTFVCVYPTRSLRYFQVVLRCAVSGTCGTKYFLSLEVTHNKICISQAFKPASYAALFGLVTESSSHVGEKIE